MTPSNGGHVGSHLNLPDARSAPPKATAADNPAEGPARLQKFMPHIAHLCNGIVNTLLQSLSACDISLSQRQPLSPNAPVAKSLTCARAATGTPFNHGVTRPLITPAGCWAFEAFSLMYAAPQ